jgi:hypothetical protein
LTYLWVRIGEAKEFKVYKKMYLDQAAGDGAELGCHDGVISSE